MNTDRPRWRRALLAGLLCVATGCGTVAQAAQSSAAQFSAAHPAHAPQIDPMSLVGTWQADGAKVRITVGRITIIQGCPPFSGMWRAGWSGAFLADLDGMATPCARTNAMAVIGALGSAVHFELDGSSRVLSDATGRVVARLVPTDPPVTEPPAADSRPPVALPAGPTPVTADRLPGNWVPAGREGMNAQLAADGTWTGTDGCGPNDGRWGVGPEGEFLATQKTMMTIVACPGPPLFHWLSGADRAGFDGETLVLLNAVGAELGRLVRAG